MLPTALSGFMAALPKPWQRYTLATAGALTVILAVRVTSSRWYDRRLLRKRSQKRDACRQALEDLETRVKRRLEQELNLELDDAEVDRITSLSLEELVGELQKRRLSARNVLAAFQLQALKAHRRTNCLVEPINEAEAWAAALDESDTAAGPLHGVPVSLKEYFGIKGYDCCLGLFSFIDRPCKDDSVLIKVLKSQGAVPFVKTNLPHMAFSYTTRNPIFGITRHPLDTTRGPGGSSGGESALIALHGSTLGFGSDIGGSIRNPCHFCGLAGLKPTGNRISNKGTFTVDATSNCLPIVIGPMARDVQSLVVAMKAILVPLMFELDRSVPPMPFRDEVYNDKTPLRIGYYTDSGLFQPDPSCQRAVLLTRDLLASQTKHTLVAWSLPLDVANTASALAIRGKLLFADRGETLLEMLQGDKAFDNVAEFEQLATMPMFVRRIFARFLRFVDPEMADYLKYSCGVSGVAEWWKVIEDVQNLRKEFEAAWDAAGLDAVICPAFGCPAMPVDELIPHRGEGSDLQVYNVLDVPAGVVPVTKVTSDDINKMADYPTTDEAYRSIKQGMLGAEGLPVGVQVVAPRWQEELCLRVMTDIEVALKRSTTQAPREHVD